MYKVTSKITLKVKGVIKTFPIGSVISLPEKSAQMFIEQGKLVPIFEPVDDLNERMAIMGENCAPEQIKPFVTEFGVLVIPFNSDKKYHYWNGGQSVCVTLKEFGRGDLISKYKSIYN
jgi:hypothetical protein